MNRYLKSYDNGNELLLKSNFLKVTFPTLHLCLKNNLCQVTLIWVNYAKKAV